MSPSRGSLPFLRGLRVPCCSSLLQTPVLRTQHSLFARHQSSSSAETDHRPQEQRFSQDFFSSTKAQVAVQEPFGHPDSDSYTIDTSLFELQEEGEYDEIEREHSKMYDVRSEDLPASEMVLHRARKSGDLQLASSTLRDLVAMQIPVIPRLKHAEFARASARAGHLDDCFLWLKHIPPRRDLIHTHTKKSVDLIIISTLQSAVRHLEKSSAESSSAWKTLLILARLGYMEGGLERVSTFIKTFSFVVRLTKAPQGYSGLHEQLNGQSVHHSASAKWTFEFWMTLQRLAEAHNLEPAKTQLAPTHPSRKESSRQLSYALNTAYNTAIRAMCRGRNIDLALYWVRKALIFESDPMAGNMSLGEIAARSLSLTTWKVFVTTVFTDAPIKESGIRVATDELMTILASFPKQSRPNPEQLRPDRKFPRVVASQSYLFLTRAIRAKKGAQQYTQWTSLAKTERVKELLGSFKLGLVIESLIRDLQDGDDRQELPQLNVLLQMQRMVTSEEEESEWQKLLEVLGSKPHSKLLLLKLKLNQLADQRQYAEALRYYFTRVHDPVMFDLARSMWPDMYYGSHAEEVSQGTQPQGILQPDRTLTQLCLRVLVVWCGANVDTLQRFYGLWLSSVRSNLPRSLVSDSSDPARQEEEVVGQDGEADGDDAYLANAHTSAPTFHQFALKLSTALYSEACKERDRTEADLMHGQAIAHVLRICQDQRAIGIDLNTFSRTNLLFTIARNAPAPTSTAGVSPIELEAKSDKSTLQASDTLPDVLITRLAVSLNLLPRDARESLPSGIRDGFNEAAKWQGTIFEGLHTNFEAAKTDHSNYLYRTYGNLIQAFLDVPKTRGGPRIEQAQMVREWYEAWARKRSSNLSVLHQSTSVGFIESALDRLSRFEADLPPGGDSHQEA